MIIKNSNLRQNVFRNRYKILAIIIAIILILCIIKTLNEISKQSQTKPKQENETVQSSYKPQETVILGSNVSQTKQEENTKIMDEFIKLCNEKQIEKAYNLLTEDCKKQIFQSNIQNFKKEFIEKIFTNTKTYSMQSWINGKNPTYKVKIIDDILATGKITEAIENYYTIVAEENGQYKLNINNYIGKEQINKKATKDNITIKILEKDIYMKYEIYTIRIQNNTNNSILLDTKTKPKSAYITGSKNVTYTAFMYELDDIYLTINPRVEKEIKVKFNKIYSPNIKNEKMTFTDIVSNIEEYKKLKDKSKYENRITIEIEI